MNDVPERDLVMEDLLGSLMAPPAKERFHERLWERIEVAGAQPLLDCLEAPPAKERFHERLWERIEAAEPGPVAAEAATLGLSPAAARRRDAGRGRRRGLGGGVPGGLAVEPGARVFSGPPPAVADVLENVRLRLDSARSLSAVFTYERAGAPSSRRASWRRATAA